MKIFHFFLRIFYKVTSFCQRKIQRACNASTVGVRALVINDKKELLLIKHTYIKEWHLPGGGVHVGEPIVTAVMRELKEEVGVLSQYPPRLFGVYFNNHMGASDYPIVYLITNFKMESSNSPEI